MRPLRILFVLFITFLVLLLSRYYFFGYLDWDLAFFNQASWQLVHGEQFVSLVGINYFGDHSYFIHFLILPFYYLFPTPVTLIILKLVAFFVAAYFIYKAADERLGKGPALGVMLLYLFLPGNLFALCYEFNPEAFAPPFLVLMFLALHNKNVRLMLLWAIPLILIKENMLLVAAGFGIRAIFISQRSERILCIIFTLACLAVFGYFTTVLIPSFRGLEHHAFTVRYAWMGNSMQDILLKPFTAPHTFLRILFSSLNVAYFMHLFSYLLIPALFSPLAIVTMLPLLLQHMLSGSIPEHLIFFHYVPAMAPFIVFAFIETLAKLSKHDKLARYVPVLVLGLLIAALPVLYSYRTAMLQRWPIMNPYQSAKVWKLINTIPSDTPVLSTFRFLAPLSSRKEIYSFHMLFSDKFHKQDNMQQSELNTNQAFVLPQRVSYALLDLDDPWYVAAMRVHKSGEIERIEAFFQDPSWQVIKSAGNVVLIQRIAPVEKNSYTK